MKYKWFFDESGVLTECEPKLDNDTKLEFAPETDEMFYRAKLSGALTFQNEFDAILAKNFGYTHIVVLKRYSDADNDYVEVWRGKFTLTDCTINYDRKTIEVTPKTIDRYTDVIAALETDYNIVKLAPKMQPVNILIRPLTQVYLLGSTKISNYVGGNSWDSTCNVPEYNDMDSVYHFVEMRNTIWFELKYKTGPNAGKHCVYYGVFPNRGMWQFPIYGKIYNSDGTYTTDNSLTCLLSQNLFNWVFNVTTLDQSERILTAQYSPLATGSNWNDLSEGSNVEDSTFNWDVIFGRTLCNTDLSDITIGGNSYNFYDVATNDFAGGNNNYTKVLPYASIDINASIKTSPDPTTWPQDNFGAYFVKPDNTPTQHYYASAPELWRAVAYWWYYTTQADAVFPQLISNRTIKDCYDLRNTIAKLLQKAGWNGQYVISGVFGSQDYVGNNLLPIITPKSNVISSYYDTPAQNAPISLSKIFRMLKQAYKVYWYIDENNNLHLEHISYFQNGYSYTELPQTLVDLESDLHTRTRHSKAYGQNVVKFDKSGMAAVIAFGWMDKQTVPFDGYDIKALDSYVEQGAKEENTIADFSTDVDFVLSSPNDVSKDGFFLFALPNVSPGVYSNTLKIEKINITDENGDNYDVTIQNGDAAFCKIHKTFWRYDMPCENLQINNVADTALTTGRFKTQSLEFSDLAMADVIGNVDNCIKLIKTQQGFGAIAKLSINLNSLATTADLVFTLFGRKYYLKGAALNGPMTITLNGEQITITVSNNRFIYGYTEPINELKFAGTDVVSVDFADTDTLAELTSADDMFKNCAELIAVNFANKAFGAVTTANDMFKGCSNLVDLICPATESWKPDIDFSDCPNLTLQSLNDLIVDFLYQYDSGVHTITPNGTMWNALTAEQQTDIMAKATAKGWQIGVPAQYALKGTSTASAVYATINGAPVEIEVVAGAFRYEYNLPITSISFENDSNVTAIDFTESDLLAGITSLNDAFKGCAALQTVDFTGCDLSNVATATDCFSGCVALTSIVADSGVWKPDLDLSDSAMAYADMLSTISILYTYSTGVHTITFNSTVWDSFSQAQQQTISDAASAKGWTTNAVVVIYVIRGTSTNVNGTETFNIQFIQDGSLSPDAAETITCAVDGDGNWEYQYSGKKIYSLATFAYNNTTITGADFSASDDLTQCTSLQSAFESTSGMLSLTFVQTLENVTNGWKAFQFCGNNVMLSMNNATFANLLNGGRMFVCDATTISLPSATFASLTDANNDNNPGFGGMFQGRTELAHLPTTIDLPKATFASLTKASSMFRDSKAAINMPLATFANVTAAAYMFYNMKGGSLYAPLATFANATSITDMFNDSTGISSINLDSAIFGEATNSANMFRNTTSLTSLSLPNATFAKTTTTSLMFAGCAATHISMPNATFARATTIERMFTGGANVQQIDISSATFAIATDGTRSFDALTSLTTLKMDSATLAALTTTTNMWRNCISLATLTLPNSASMPTEITFQYSPLTYQSMLNVANWLTDFTGRTSPTLTFKTSAWNALSAAEQATIQGILQAKNWNLATA